MSATTVKLLKAAAEIAGGNKTLAARLGIRESMLSKFMSDTIELPDTLLLRAVDIILDDRLTGPPLTAQGILPEARDPARRT